MRASRLVKDVAVCTCREPTNDGATLDSQLRRYEPRGAMYGSPMPRGERIAKPAERGTRLAGLFFEGQELGVAPTNGLGADLVVP